MTSSMKSRLFVWIIIVSVIPLIAIGSFSYYLIFEKISKQNEETITNINRGIYNMVDTQQKVLSRWLDSAAAFFNSKLTSLGDSHFDYNNMVDMGGYRLPTWYIGQQKITGDYTLVDDLIEKEKLPASIFYLHNNKFIRVSTNVRQPDGTRIVGTVLESGPVYDRIINGQLYLGRANVEGIMHATIYQPLWDKTGKLIGAFVLGRREQEYELIHAIKNIVVGETGYVFVMDPEGTAIIHPTRQGKSLSEYPWAREILQKKNGSISYDFEGQRKIAYYTYYEPWNWYIVTGSYEAEIFNTARKLFQMLLLTMVAAVALSSFIAYILSNTFFRPIKEFMQVMRQVQSGDLSARLNYFFDDEFRILSNAFNTMLNNLSLLIGRIFANSTKLKEASQRLIVDINESNQSLKGIETSVDNLRQATPRDTREFSVSFNHSVNEELQQAVYHLQLLIERITANKNDEDLKTVKVLLDRIETLQKSLYNLPHDSKDADLSLAPTSITYINKINSLEVEVQKLKLLLKNIASSASSLDDIALSLDRYVNAFKIDSQE